MSEVNLSSNLETPSLDMSLGETKYLPWSYSRMDVANSCLYKFYKVYLEDIRESSPALTLGGLSHEIIAALLRDKDVNLQLAYGALDYFYPKYRSKDTSGIAYEEARNFLLYMVEFVGNWQKLIRETGIKRYFVEHEYGLTEDLKRASYSKIQNRDVYIRCIVDLWAYDKKTKTLYVVDHKTNKSSQSSTRVHDSHQLNLHVGILSRVYKLKWERAYIALNFLRRNRITWAVVTPEENKLFMEKYFNTLHFLESRLFDCDQSLIYPATPSYKCSWCTFKDTCQSYSKKV